MSTKRKVITHKTGAITNIEKAEEKERFKKKQKETKQPSKYVVKFINGVKSWVGVK
jgi:hypothetical protein